jgi:hypothetical protein
MIEVVIGLLLAACGADSSRSRVETAPAVGSNTPVATPIDADANKTSDPKAPTRECFCFSWVHLDENGESCFETQPKCDTEFKAFGRTDKIPCSSAHRPTCGSYACRNIGKECFRL